MAEKLRAVGGQRRFAISRDVYDIHQLFTAGVSLAAVGQILPAKFAAKGMDMTSFTPDYFEGRRYEFEQDWNLRLNYLLPSLSVEFSVAWASAKQVIEKARSYSTPESNGSSRPGTR